MVKLYFGSNPKNKRTSKFRDFFTYVIARFSLIFGPFKQLFFLLFDKNPEYDYEKKIIKNSSYWQNLNIPYK
jgi:hypothetical protein